MLHRMQMEWRCRRGMRELDLLLQAYLRKEFNHAGVAEQRAFQRLLGRQNTELLDYLFGRSNPQDRFEDQVVRKIRHFASSQP